MRHDYRMNENSDEDEPKKITSNKSLYDEILNLSEDDTAELQDHTSAASYTSCSLSLTLAYNSIGRSTRTEYGRFDDNGIFIQSGLATRLIASKLYEVISCSAGGSPVSVESPVTPVVSSGSKPPFMEVVTYTSGNYYVQETWWPTGAVDYEAYASVSDSGQCVEWLEHYKLPGPPCGAGVDCHGSGYQWDYPNKYDAGFLGWKLCDKNEAPNEIQAAENGICRDLSGDRLWLSLSSLDPDTFQPNFRRHRYTLTGPDASNFEIRNVVTGTNPSSAQVYALQPHDWFGSREVSVVVTDMDGNGLSVTGGPYRLVLGDESWIDISTECSNIVIPDDTPNGAVVGFLTTDYQEDGRCGLVDTNLQWSNIDPDGTDRLGQRISKNYLQVEGHRKLGMASPVFFYSGLESQQNPDNSDPPVPAEVYGRYSIRGTTFNVGTEACCGASGELSSTMSRRSMPYDIFLTGVGPDVPFSGGAGNVEESYIQFANSQQTKLAIFPASSGGASQDEYFYIYNVGQTGLLGVAPPSAGLKIQNAICYTGVPSNPRILIQYNDAGNNTFYNYSVTGDTFSAETFVTSGIHQIVKPKANYSGITNAGMTLENSYAIILASGEAFIYDPYIASATGLDYNLDFNITGQVAVLSSIHSADFSSRHPSATSQWVRIGQRIDGEGLDQFGHPLAINSTGNIIAVGEKSHDGNPAAQGDNRGRVRVYSFSDSSSSWSRLGQDIYGQNDDDSLGRDIAINSTGNIVAISCLAAERPVRVYQLSGSSWVQLGNDITGDTAAPGVTNKYWGYSLDLNSDGSRIAIGNLFSDHVQVYDLIGSTWTQVGNNIDGEQGRLSGSSVALNSVGNRVVIGDIANSDGGQGAGHVRVYELVGSTWTQLGQDIDGQNAEDALGWAVDINSNGDRIVIGAPAGAGAGEPHGYAIVYEYSGSSWVKLGNNIDGENALDSCGDSVSINSAGDRIVVGSYTNDDGGQDAGSVRVFDWSGSAWTKVEQDIDGEAENHQLGLSVGINSVGDRIVCGSDLADNGRGSVYVFNRGQDGHIQAGKSRGEFTVFPLGSYQPAEFNYPLIISGIGNSIAATSGASINTGIYSVSSSPNHVGGLSGILHSYNNGNDYDILETPDYYVFGMQHELGHTDPGGALYFYDKTSPDSQNAISISGYTSPGDGVDRRRLFTVDFSPEVNNHCNIEIAFCSYSQTGSHKVFFNSAMSASGMGNGANEWYHLDDHGANILSVNNNSLTNGNMSGVIERVVKISPNPENSRNRTQTFLLGENGSLGTIFDHYSRAYNNGPFAWQGGVGGPTVLTFSSGTGVDTDTPYNIGQYSNIISTNGIVFAMPRYTYNVFPSGNLIGFSPNTTAADSIKLFDTAGGLTSRFYADETAVSFAASQTTTGEIFLGTFTVQDDEFNGGLQIDFASDLGDDVFVAKNVGNGTGEIYIKSGVTLNFENEESPPGANFPFTGYISGIDPFVGGVPFIDQFILDVLDIQEEPTGLSISPSSGSISQNYDFNGQHLAVSNLIIQDPDVIQSGGFHNVLSITGPDANNFLLSGAIENQTPSNQITVSGLSAAVYLKSTTILNSETKPQYNVIFTVQQEGGKPIRKAIAFALNVFDDPPTGVSIIPPSTSILESFTSDTPLALATFSLLDPDTTDNNTVQIIGPDSSFFTTTYDGITNSGTLFLARNSILDFETKPIITGLIGAKQVGAVEASATGTFLLNLIDVLEPVGISAAPSTYYIDEGTISRDMLLSSLTFTDQSTHPGTMSITNIQFATGEWRDALDIFSVKNNIATNPVLYLNSGVVLDYEIKNLYDIVISGYHANETRNKYGAAFKLIVRDVDEPPTITLSGTEFTLSEHTNTNLDNIFVSRIFCLDEFPGDVSLSLEGADANNFIISGIDVPENTIHSNVHVGNLFLKSGTDLSFLSKPTHTVNVIGFDNVGRGTGVFTLTIDESDICHIDVSGVIITNSTCFDSNNGSINLGNVEFTGTNATSCFGTNVVIVEWDNLSIDAVTTPNNLFVTNLASGDYTARFYSSGNAENLVPQLSNVETYTVSAPERLSIVQVVQDSNECLATGSMSVTATGGTPPYTIDYASFSVSTTGSEQTAIISGINSNISGILTVTDTNGCLVTGQSFEYSFDSLDKQYSFESSTAPTVYDSTLSSYKFNVSNGAGPYDINIYYSVSGEKGQLYDSIDRYDTSVLSARSNEYDRIFYDESGNMSVASNQKEEIRKTYYYDIGSKLYPGSYIFEFINPAGCSLLTNIQTALNSIPLTSTLQLSNDSATDIAFDVEVDQSLNSLFIPYNMIKKDADLLSFLSNITHSTDIKIQVGKKIYTRKALEGSLTCDDIIQLNITFLGMKPTEWFYIFPIFKGFSLDDTSVDILNENIYLILPNKKIKIVTKFNNNTRSIKLLRGGRLLTTSTNTTQFTPNALLKLNTFDFITGDFKTIAEDVVIHSTKILHNKYIPGQIFAMDILNNTNVSQYISTENITEINFDCNSQQRHILNHKKFIEELNNFSYTFLYVKRSNYVINGGSIGLFIEGGDANFSPPFYDVTYKYYNTDTKELLPIFENGKEIKEDSINSLPAGNYVIKIKDNSNNILRLVNGQSYDSFYSAQIDYIHNELNASTGLLDYQYGDLLAVIYNINDFAGIPIPPNIPGVEPPAPPPRTPTELSSVKTETYQVSPNTSLNNSLTIICDPVLTKYVVTGPLGYNRTFDQRTILTQIPPGVYDIVGETKDLDTKFLRQDRRCLKVTETSTELVILKFVSYADRAIIGRDINNTINTRSISSQNTDRGGSSSSSSY